MQTLATNVKAPGTINPVRFARCRPLIITVIAPLVSYRLLHMHTPVPALWRSSTDTLAHFFSLKNHLAAAWSGRAGNPLQTCLPYSVHFLRNKTRTLLGICSLPSHLGSASQQCL